MKKLLLVLTILLVLGACSKPTTTAKAEETVVNSVQQTQVPTQAAAVQPTTVAPAPVAPQTPQRTVIENGEVKVWAETFNRDETIKPIKYEAEMGKSGAPLHRLYYNVDGHEIKVVVNEKSGDRYFYKDGKSVTFAQIGKSVKDSNENILLQVKINDMLNEEVKKKYK